MNDYQHIVIIGAQRAGSTFLYNLLQAQPEIFMAQPVRPEPKYFLSDRVSYEDYRQKLFLNPPKGTRFLGEKSVSYYESAEVADRLKTTLPEAHLFLVLRNPVDRALSNYDFSFTNGLETRSLREVFLDGVDAPKTRMATSVDPFNYLGRSDYLPFIRQYSERFGEQLKILLFEELIRGQANEEIETFLNLSHQLNPLETKGAVNPVTRSKVPEDVRADLIAYFAPKIESLEAFLDRDLSEWKN